MCVYVLYIVTTLVIVLIERERESERGSLYQKNKAKAGGVVVASEANKRVFTWTIFDESKQEYPCSI
jgi:hypothetical protein